MCPIKSKDIIGKKSLKSRGAMSREKGLITVTWGAHRRLSKDREERSRVESRSRSRWIEDRYGDKEDVSGSKRSNHGEERPRKPQAFPSSLGGLLHGIIILLTEYLLRFCEIYTYISSSFQTA